MKLKNAEKRHQLTTRDYAELARFRYALRSFLRFSEAAAAEVGLTTQHYQAMLVVRSWPEDRRVSIAELAEQLLIKHNSAVGLVDRLEQEGLLVREPSTADRRKVELRLSPQGRQVLAKLASMHRQELQRIGPNLHRFFAEVTRMHQSGRKRQQPSEATATRTGAARKRVVS